MLQLQYGRMISEHYYRAVSLEAANVDNRAKPLSVNSCGRVVRIAEFTTNVPKGRHDFYLMYLLSGKLEAAFGEREAVLTPGSFVCISPETSYRYHNDGNQEIYYLALHFTGSEAFSVLSQAGIAVNTAYCAGIHNKIVELYESLFSVFRSIPGNFEFSVETLVRYILYSLCTAAEENRRAGERTFEESLKYIHSHLDSSISVEELAAIEYLSPSRYRSIFRTVTGCSPKEYITRQKIRLSCSLLAETDMEIRQIAERAGYPDRLYFQRIFKKETGMTPLEYRQQA